MASAIVILSDPALTLPLAPFQRSVRRRVSEILEIVGPRRQATLMVCVLLCGDGAIRRLNRVWLGRDRPTNVISFRSFDQEIRIRSLGPVPLDAASAPAPHFRGVKGELILGDMAVGLERACREARRAGVEPAKWAGELARHGLLHILGYSHRTMPRP